MPWGGSVMFSVDNGSFASSSETSGENESIPGSSGIVDPELSVEHALAGESLQANEEEGEALAAFVDARAFRAESWGSTRLMGKRIHPS